MRFAYSTLTAIAICAAVPLFAEEMSGESTEHEIGFDSISNPKSVTGYGAKIPSGFIPDLNYDRQFEATWKAAGSASAIQPGSTPNLDYKGKSEPQFKLIQPGFDTHLESKD